MESGQSDVLHACRWQVRQLPLPGPMHVAHVASHGMHTRSARTHVLLGHFATQSLPCLNGWRPRERHVRQPSTLHVSHLGGHAAQWSDSLT